MGSAFQPFLILWSKFEYLFVVKFSYPKLRQWLSIISFSKILNLQNFIPALTKRSRFEAIQWKYDVSGR